MRKLLTSSTILWSRVLVCVTAISFVLPAVHATKTDSDLSLKHPDMLPSLDSAYGKLPLQFEINLGQTDPEVQFLSRGPGYHLFLTQNGALLSLRKREQSTLISDSWEHADLEAPVRSQVQITLLGANPSPTMYGEQELPGKVNYFRAKNAENWHTEIPTYEKVLYEDIYPGVDLVFYGNQRELEYDFVVSPGADYRAIELQIKGAEELRIDERGDLIVGDEGDSIVMRAPNVYQVKKGERQAIGAHYVLLDDNRILFDLASYDKQQPLIIDPIISYSTYLGGTIEDKAFDIAVDGKGNAYVIGVTDSVDFPTVNPLQTNLGGLDVFVSKIDSSGTALIYSTYFGGDNTDIGSSIAVDSVGNAYIMGGTFSQENSFPITEGVFQSNWRGGTDAFVAKLNPTGSVLLFSTYLGGSQDENRNLEGDIAVDTLGNVYISGQTESPDFPTKNPLQAVKAGDSDAFIAKINPTGSELIYSTYLGGSDDNGEELALGIAVDMSGSTYVEGRTRSTDFPTKNALQPTNAGDVDVFLAKLNPTGSALVYSTYLGGSRWDSGYGFSIDNDSNSLITGSTQSSDLPIKDALQSNFAGGATDAFVMKLNSSGKLVFSTYLGGSENDSGAGIAADGSGNLYVSGSTLSTDFPTANALQSLPGGMQDVFVTKIDPQGSEIIYSTYLGGSQADGEQGIQRGDITVDDYGDAYLTSYTESPDFPTVNPLQSELKGDLNAFVTKISLARVTIDIKPRDEQNVVNPRSKGGIWVAILSDTAPDSPFDPSSEVDIPTIEFGPDGAKAIRHKVKDINKDGLGDLLLRFKIPETGIACGDTEATLIGETFDGISFTGTDAIKTVGCEPKKCHKKKHHHDKHHGMHHGKNHADDCGDDEKHHSKHKEKEHHKRHYSKHHGDDHKKR